MVDLIAFFAAAQNFQKYPQRPSNRNGPAHFGSHGQCNLLCGGCAAAATATSVAHWMRFFVQYWKASLLFATLL